MIIVDERLYLAKGSHLKRLMMDFDYGLLLLAHYNFFLQSLKNKVYFVYMFQRLFTVFEIKFFEQIF